MNQVRTISCTVSRVLFPKEEVRGRRFCVMLTSVGKAKGELCFTPEPGMRLVLQGSDETDRGERVFHFARVSHDVPVDRRALLEYAAKLARGVGQKTADAVWERFGESWTDHVDELKPSVAIALSRSLDVIMSDSGRSELAVFCISNGVGPSVAEKAWNAWKRDAIGMMKANPYVLVDLGGVGFKTADELAGKLGFSRKDFRRACAAVDYCVRDLMEQGGNSIVERDALYKCLDDLKVDRELAALAVMKSARDGRIVFASDRHLTVQSVVDHDYDLVNYASNNTAKLDVPVSPSDFDLDPDESQVRAVRNVVCRVGISVVNGGAGVGKSTIVRAIVNVLERRGERVVLCAFAGKAAARVREATGRPASTIHSMLGWTGDGRGFSRGQMIGENVIVDEASMIPSALLYEITKRNPRRLILVGDQAQLQPVGIGAPFHDLIDTMPGLVSTLDKCYRNREAVFANALRIRNGLVPENAESKSERFRIVEVSGPQSAHDFVVDRVKAGDVDFAQDVVLAPRNGDGEEPAPCTVKSINESVQAIVNPHGSGERFRVGDRVMCVKNFPALDIWNGTTGFISRIDAKGDPWFAKDGGCEVRLGREQRDAVVPAYCVTVHKSQGSQYRDVYVCALKRDCAVLMDRSMLYTAVTRARRACYLVCDGCVDRVVNTTHRRATYFRLIAEGNI